MKQNAWRPVESMTNPELGQWITTQVARLKGVTDFPSIEVNAIAAHFLQKNKAWIVAHPEARLEPNQLDLLEAAVDRLAKGEPLAYITGRRSFYGLDLAVDQRALIPRPETELLVELAIDWLEKNPGKVRVADIGTGSGAIAVVLADRFANLRVTATDRSADVLDLARLNAENFHVEGRIRFFHTDLLDGINTHFDLILANLPYIPTHTLEELPNLKYEPRSALDGGADGLDYIRNLINTLERNLLQNSCIFLEIQYNQDIVVTEIALTKFPQAQIKVHHDLAALPRVVQIQL